MMGTRLGIKDPIKYQPIRWEVTGVDTSGKRFKLTYPTASWAMGINLYRGSVWMVLPSGKRIRVRTVRN